MPEITGRIFWENHCDNKPTIQWSKFSSSFQEQYGKQSTRAMDSLMKNLCTLEPIGGSRSPSRKVAKFNSNCPPTPGGFTETDGYESTISSNYYPIMKPFLSTKFNQARTIVRSEIFAKFCLDHDGLYEGFITISDPATQVFSLGTIEEDTFPQMSMVRLPKSVGGLVGIKILQVSCGGEHAAVLTEEGVVATWGKGGFGRLGHGDGESSLRPRQVQVLKNEKFIKIACGFAYTTAITSKGTLYAWGAGENGRLGLGDDRDRFSPHKVLLPHSIKVLDVQAGSVHTCLLTEKGRIFSCGKYEYTGHGDKRDVLIPKKLDFFSKF